MINYNNGKVYKIEPMNGAEGEIYIGSTTKNYLSQRMTTHRSGYNSFKNGKSPFVTSYLLFDKYGVENCKILLLELVNVNSKDELLTREAHYIKTLACVNKSIPLQTRKEYYQENRKKLIEYCKEYNEEHKDRLKEYHIEYYQENREKLIEYCKEYNEKNKEKIKEYQKEYVEQHKDQLKEYQKEYYKKYIKLDSTDDETS